MFSNEPDDSGALAPRGQSLLQRWTRCPCSASEALRKRWSVKWYEQVYRGRGDRMPQLTWRAVLMGTALGGALSLTNLYIGLKAGWGFGVAITACILSYAIWTTLHRARIVRTPMTILENNCMQSTASSAGYSTGGTLISAFAAYMLITNTPLSLPVMLAWVFFLSVLGVTMAPSTGTTGYFSVLAVYSAGGSRRSIQSCPRSSPSRWRRVGSPARAPWAWCSWSGRTGPSSWADCAATDR